MSAHEHGAPRFQGSATELEDHASKSANVTTKEQLEGRTDLQDEVDGATRSSVRDAIEMRRMGKSQQLIRRFRQITIAAFIGTAVSAWEYALFLVSPGLIDGGTAGLLYNVLWSFFGFSAIYLSLAEMVRQLDAKSLCRCPSHSLTLSSLAFRLAWLQ